MRWRLAISALLFALPLLARAEIEFGLVQTIQLPQNMQQSSFRSWDVQHWMDNESYGWAVVAADTIVYRVSLDRPFESARVPSAVYAGIAEGGLDSLWASPQFIRIQGCEIPFTEPNAVLAAHIATYNGLFTERTGILANISLRNNFMLARKTYAEHSHYYGSESGEYVETVFPWPPPPTTPGELVLITRSWGDWYQQGGSYNSTNWDNFYRYALPSLTTDYYHRNSGMAMPYVRTGPLSCAGVASAWYHGHNEYGDTWGWDSCFVFNVNFESRQYEQIIRCASSGVPQQDSAAEGRIVIFDGQTLALSETGFDTLWTSPNLAGTLTTARLAGSPDERILAWNSDTRRYGVFDATDGSFMDSTSALPCEPTYWIKRPGYDSEAVCFDSAARSVRIFKTHVTSIRGLTASYISESNRIRIGWPELPNVTGYRIYISPVVTDNPYQVLADVPAGQTSYEFTPEQQQRFFYVTAIY